MKRVLVVGAIAALFAGFVAAPAFSQSSGNVDTHVTPELVSIAVTGGPIDYGSVPLSVADNSRSTKVGGPFDVTNNGSVMVDLSIHGTNATTSEPNNNDWTLDCTPSNGVVGQDQFVHRFTTSGSPTWDSAPVLCNSVGQAKPLFSDLASIGMINVSLQITMPTGSTGFAQRTSQVIVTATSSN